MPRTSAGTRTVAGSRTTLPAPILLQNLFTTNTTGFSAVAGVWAITAGELQNTSSQGAGSDWANRLFLSDDSFTDFEIVTRVKKPSFNIGIAFRSSTTAGSGYGIELRDSNNFRLEDWGSSNLSQSSPISWVTGTYYWVKIRMQGNNIKARVWTDGDEEGSTWNIDAYSTLHSTGRIGFMGESSSGTSIFDEITIYTLNRRITD